MSKVAAVALLRDIHRLVAEIHQNHLKLDDAGKKDLSFIHKHLRKAGKAIKRIVAKTQPIRGAEKKTASPRATRKREPRSKEKGSTKTAPTHEG
ncbi:MAG TPA: hypothetical protein VMG09_08570 [Bacteroidota bacterium]|nr:hypothetical protein [Bacteroidota bacterium]